MDTLSYHLEDEAALTFACLSFVKGGGLFFKGISHYNVGDIIAVNLRLMNEDDSIEFLAKVVWLTPKHERDQWPEGIGVQFSEEDAKRVREKIETVMSDAFTRLNDSSSFLM